MRTARIRAASIVAAVLVMCTDLSAQVPVGLGFRIGASHPLSGNFGTPGGGSLETFVTLRVNDALAVYLMSGIADLGEHESEDPVWINSNGHSIGVDATFGTRAGRRPMPWLHAGIGMFQVQAEGGFMDSFSDESPLTLGFDVGAGLDVAVTPRWRLTPAVRMVSFSPDWEYSGGFTSGRVDSVRYVAFDLGVAYHFGVKKKAERR